MWRTVSSVDNIELNFSGNVVSPAIDLGDVDNDKENELVVANIDGDLAVFKGDNSQPWKRASNLGMIMCVRIGNICNTGKNVLVCLTSEGHCYIYNMANADTSQVDWQIGEEGDTTGESKMLTPAYTQNLPANCRTMIIADTNGDGLNEMAVAYSDRVVRTFRWEASGESDVPFVGRLVQLEKWQLAGQIGAVTVNWNPDGHPELLASQPGRTYVTLLSHTAQHTNGASSESEDLVGHSILFHPLGYHRTRNKDVSTVIVGGIQRGKDYKGTYHALSSLDGSMLLVNNDKVVWSLQVDHQLFALDKLDVTGNGEEEVVCCSWDGQTYIVNHSREVVRYHFKGNVAAFTAGYFSVPDKGNVPCFVYVTFNNHIYIHHSIQLSSVESASLVAVMERQEQTKTLLENLLIDSSHQESLRALYHWALYGWRPLT